MPSITSLPEGAVETVEQILLRAIAHQQAGEWQDAERLYRAILQVQPDHPDAHHNLGVLALQLKQPAAALPHLQRALASNPNQGQFWLSTIKALIATEQMAEARHVLAQGRERGLQGEAVDALASRLEEDSPSLAEEKELVALFTAQRYPEAVTRGEALTARFPRYFLGWKLLAAACTRLGQPAAALLSWQKAAALSPRDHEVQTNLGTTCNALGRFAEAEEHYRRALTLKPDYAEGHGALGNILHDLGRLAEAETSYCRALALNPRLAAAQNNLGVIIQELGRLGEAEACYRRALAIRPQYADAHLNLANTLKELCRFEEALDHYRLALAAKGDWQETLRRLTNPLVVTTGLLLAPPGPTVAAATELPLAPRGKTPVSASADLGPGEPWPTLAPGDPRGGGRKKPRIILIYPPPWQISSAGDPRLGMPFAPPQDRSDHYLDGDFQVITYGLLSIAAQAKRAGYEVEVYNLATSQWSEVEALIAGREAELFGLSAFTANRRGMSAVAALIRAHHPHAHITAGGPFVTALPREILRYYREIDTAVIGEGEATFMALVEAVETGQPAVGIPGTAWRDSDKVVVGPPRARIADLDGLAPPADYFTSHIVMTSRGCPGRCTFCGSFTTWGKRLCFLSAAACLATIEKALARLPIPFLAIKDDTFTANRQRALAICDGIIAKGLNFIWSCDTRVDCLDDELLRRMRLAGCQTISLGVESGSPAVLKTIRKATTPEMVLAATRAAQKYGIYVRYYMIIPNRGESVASLRQSIDLIKAGRPNGYVVCPLSFYPGTEDWAILQEEQGLTADIFFQNDFKELAVSKNRFQEYQDILLQATVEIGAIHGFEYTVEERQAVVERLPDLAVVHLELANACCRAGRLAEASSALDRAEELGFPISTIIDNQRACLALAGHQVDTALALLERSCRANARQIGVENLKKLKVWAARPLSARGAPPVLNDSLQAMDFNLLLAHPPRPVAL